MTFSHKSDLLFATEKVLKILADHMKAEISSKGISFIPSYEDFSNVATKFFPAFFYCLKCFVAGCLH